MTRARRGRLPATSSPAAHGVARAPCPSRWPGRWLGTTLRAPRRAVRRAQSRAVRRQHARQQRAHRRGLGQARGLLEQTDAPAGRARTSPLGAVPRPAGCSDRSDDGSRLTARLGGPPGRDRPVARAHGWPTGVAGAPPRSDGAVHPTSLESSSSSSIAAAESGHPTTEPRGPDRPGPPPRGPPGARRPARSRLDRGRSGPASNGEGRRSRRRRGGPVKSPAASIRASASSKEPRLMACPIRRWSSSACSWGRDARHPGRRRCREVEDLLRLVVVVVGEEDGGGEGRSHVPGREVVR